MDVEAAHQDAFAGNPGILLTVGTGSMAWGRNSQGREVRAGGGGSLLGEEGSGYWLAVQGLRAVVRSLDGRGPETGLSAAVLERLGMTDPRSLIPWVGSATKADIAELAPLILRVAEAGDGPAGEVRASALRELCLDVVTVLEELGLEGGSLPVALAGGLVEMGSAFRELVVRELGEAGAVCLSQSVVPARGAASLALELHLHSPSSQQSPSPQQPPSP
jgi:N-acetylglucosamine kinase-like BadF-type ATPase